MDASEKLAGDVGTGILTCFAVDYLASLSKRLERFTLRNVLSEIDRWLKTGRSVFQEELAELHHATGRLRTANP